MKKVEVLSDKPALIERALQLTIAKMTNAIAERGVCTIALSGGSTPKPLYEAIAAQHLPWEKIHVFWGDERYVPPNHPDSNQLMARQAWLNRVNIPGENIHPIPTNEADPAVAARKYEEHLQAFFQTSGDEFPKFDIILLGMGSDGHTASLFPHTEALKARGLIAVGNKQEEPRITFTVPLINHARCVVFVVAGADKKAALAQVFAPDADDFNYPSRLIQPQGELWWLLDQSAGEELQVSTAAES
ncbi:6-phosphogluconolactonase [Chroogloeocystis siderophila]|uniref:6-phosphogluconolactonase n=1 Tax=Chroogloeocystis siderophila 5.2 s.c.1 TaxID=247279 RepID=A0A1U7HBJ4_9CHRO|nr:6-phosphogluconolactonase [Chroogloeocystis siderophila]OKH20921.1 6-phosphogluconolactonase [Chroogloeocystis siderophila 5.2 s.c.1]